MAPRRPRLNHDCHRGFHVLLVAARVLAAIVFVQLSGLGHVAGDIVEVLTIGHHHDTSNERDDDSDHPCPPGCPTCHHVHPGGASLPPEIAPAVAAIPLLDVPAVNALASSDAPRGPPRPAIYRPPRA
jgi:hypothetical protein